MKKELKRKCYICKKMKEKGEIIEIARDELNGSIQDFVCNKCLNK